jgi:hypothetical protein
MDGASAGEGRTHGDEKLSGRGNQDEKGQGAADGPADAAPSLRPQLLFPPGAEGAQVGLPVGRLGPRH